jgi:multiple sugar transport system substrate-binding protein
VTGAVGVGALLAACGAPDPGGPAGGAVPPPARKGTLAVGNQLTYPEQDAIRALSVQVFRERHPGVRVEEVNAPFQQYNQKLLAMLADGTLPDALHLYYGQAAGGPADLAARGALLPLDDLVRRDAGPGALDWGDILPAARQAARYESRQVTLPCGGVAAAVVFFNRELIRAAGREAPDALLRRGRWTWDTLVEEATRLTARAEDGALLRAGVGSPLHWEPGTWATVLLRSYGADYLSPDGRRVVTDSPAGRRALQVLTELGPRRRTMPLAGDGDTAELVKQGRVAQALLWFVAAAWWRPLAFDWDVAPVPAGPAGRPLRAVISRLGIAARSPARDLAWDYAVEAVSPAVDLAQAVRFGQLPLRRASLPAWRAQTRPLRPGNLDLIEATLGELSLDALRRPHPRQGAVDALLQRELAALLLESKPADLVAQTLASEGDALLAGA